MENERNVVAPHLPQLARIRAHHLVACIFDRTGHLGAFRQKADCGQSRHRFARPAFAHQGHRLTLVHGERHAANGRTGLSVLPEPDREVFDIQNKAHEKVFLGSKASRTPSKMNTKSDMITA